MSSVQVEQYEQGRRVLLNTPSRHERVQDVLLALVLAILAMAILTGAVWKATTYSIFDEPTHLDYVWKVANGHFPAKGDVLSQYTFESWTCRGQDGIALPACTPGEEYDTAEFGINAYNYNYFHPPLYYLYAAGFAKAILATGVDLDFVTAARLASASLVSLGLGLVFLALRKWNIRISIAFSVAVMILCVPSVIHSGSTVNNDAISVAAGASFIWLLAKIYLENRIPIFRAVMIAIVISLGKTITAVGVVSIGLMLGVAGVRMLWRGEWKGAIARLGTATGMALGIAVPYFLWSLFQQGRGDPGYSNPLAAYKPSVVGWPFDEWSGTALSGFRLAADYWVQATLDTPQLRFSSALLAILGVSAVFVLLATVPRNSAPWRLGEFLIAAMLLMPFIVQIREYFLEGDYFVSMAARYTLSLLPAAGLAWGIVLSNRRQHLLPACTAVFCLVCVVTSILL